jgi:hypothetical protein
MFFIAKEGQKKMIAMLLSFSFQIERRRRQRHHYRCLIHSKKKTKEIKKEEKGRSLPSSSHFYHWVEAPFALRF